MGSGLARVYCTFYRGHSLVNLRTKCIHCLSSFPLIPPPLPYRISIFEFVVDETQEDPIVKFVGEDPVLQYVSYGTVSCTHIKTHAHMT